MPENRLKNLFKEKRVFITGHTGFKGSWLASLLNLCGADVLGYALEPATEISHFDLLGLRKQIRHVIGDIRDLSHLTETLTDFEPDFVFHMAAQALVRPSYEDPISTFSTNILGSANLLEACRHCDSIKSLVYITSDKCYENVEWVWGYKETDKLGGRDPYSASKAAAEIVFSSYLRSFYEDRLGTGLASVRAGNVIGGGDWAVDRIIPDCIRAVQAGVPLELRSPNATRPWQHVLEPLSGYLLLAEKLYEDGLKYRGAWNFGPSTNVVKTVKEVADTLIKHLEQGEVINADAASSVHEATLLQLNCEKAHHVLGWAPRWGVEKSVEQTALWYKDYFEGKSVKEITKGQILEFFPELS